MDSTEKLDQLLEKRAENNIITSIIESSSISPVKSSAVSLVDRGFEKVYNFGSSYYDNVSYQGFLSVTKSSDPENLINLVTLFICLKRTGIQIPWFILKTIQSFLFDCYFVITGNSTMDIWDIDYFQFSNKKYIEEELGYWGDCAAIYNNFYTNFFGLADLNLPRGYNLFGFNFENNYNIVVDIARGSAEIHMVIIDKRIDKKIAYFFYSLDVAIYEFDIILRNVYNSVGLIQNIN